MAMHVPSTANEQQNGLTELQQQVVGWLATGEVGISSQCMAMWLAFGQRTRDAFGGYPRDPDDMNRCLKLLIAAPGLRPLLPKMAELNRSWAALVARWDEIEASQLDEIGIDWKKAKSAPRTYALMQQVLDRK